MKPFKNTEKNSKVEEAGAGVEAELGLQRSSTNPPLQTTPKESQVLTVAAGPGSPGWGTNVVPQQIAMEEDANQQVTARSSSDRKRLKGHSPARDEESEEAQAGAPANDEHKVGRRGAFGCSEDQPSDGDSGGHRLPGVGPVTRAVRTLQGGHVACYGQRTGQRLAEI